MYTHIKYIPCIILCFSNFILFVKIRLTWIANISSAKRLRKSLYRKVSVQKLRGTIVASPLLDLIDIDFSFALINTVHWSRSAYRWRRRMLQFDAATFHQPSRRNIVAQADTRWAFIAEIQGACGMANLRRRDQGGAPSLYARAGPAWQD